MKAIRLYSRIGTEPLRVEDAPTPTPGFGEVLIRVFAAAVTPTELLWAPTWTTRLGEPRTLPVIPGHEFSGEVANLGEGITGVSVGDVVYGMNDWFCDGAQAEFCIAAAENIAPKPLSVDHTHASVVPISGLTAWQGLFIRGKLSSGQHVLIHGGAGAVGGFAIQFARFMGARITATASASNIEFVKALGAETAIDYQSERFEQIARNVDLVFDTVGGDTLQRSFDVLSSTGRVITIATSEEATKDQRISDAFFIVEPNRDQLNEITCLIDSGKISPLVSAVFPIYKALDAYRFKATRGKAVLQM